MATWEQKYEGLKKARALIDHPDKWCRLRFTDGDRMCLDEAIRRASDDQGTRMALREGICEAVGKRYEGPEQICSINNTREHAALMALFDKAIDKLAPVAA